MLSHPHWLAHGIFTKTYGAGAALSSADSGGNGGFAMLGDPSLEPDSSSLGEPLRHHPISVRRNSGRWGPWGQGVLTLSGLFPVLPAAPSQACSCPAEESHPSLSGQLAPPAGQRDRAHPGGTLPASSFYLPTASFTGWECGQAVNERASDILGVFKQP